MGCVYRLTCGIHWNLRNISIKFICSIFRGELIRTDKTVLNNPCEGLLNLFFIYLVHHLLGCDCLFFGAMANLAIKKAHQREIAEEPDLCP